MGNVASSRAGGDDHRVALPRLLDLGADKCVPCKMMAPILDELKTEFAGSLTVEFIDVWKNPEAAQALRHQSHSDPDLLRRRRNGAVPARGILFGARTSWPSGVSWVSRLPDKGA